MIDHRRRNFGTTARSDATTNGWRRKTLLSRMAAPSYPSKGFLIGGGEDLFRSGFLKFLMESLGGVMLLGRSWTAESGPHGILGDWDPESDPVVPKIKFRKV